MYIYVLYVYNYNFCFMPKLIDVVYNLEVKNQTGKIVKIHKDFELYEVLMYNFPSQTVLIFAVYISFRKIIETFWSRGVTDIWLLAHFELKICNEF